MKLRSLLLCLSFFLGLNSCIVTESMVINADGSGDFLMTYDLSKLSDQMGGMFGDLNTEDMEESDGMLEDSYEEQDDKDEQIKDEDYDLESEIGIEERPSEQPIDTLIVFDEMFETYKDSIASLPEEERQMLESLRGLYMKMKNDESKGIIEMGIGMKFKSIDELKDIQKRVKTARDMNANDVDVDAMSADTPMGSLMGDDNSEITYSYSKKTFVRTTTQPESNVKNENQSKDIDPNDAEFQKSLEGAAYIVSYTFPKRIKKTTIKGAEISEDGKQITYKTNWLLYINNPKLLDINIEFEDE